MNRELIGLTAILWLACGALSLGQVESRPPGSSAGRPSRASSGDSRPMFEDIEVMRQILRRSLPASYGLRTAAVDRADPFGKNSDGGAVGSYDDPARRWHALTGTVDTITTTGAASTLFRSSHPHVEGWMRIAGHEGFSVEGTYLKGQGVVFSIELPPSAGDPMPAAAKPAPKQPSPWEAVRSELRGEKADAKDTRETRQEFHVADVLLQLMAENGRHFSQLADNEQLTFAVTFRGSACTACHMPVLSEVFDLDHGKGGKAGGTGAGSDGPGPKDAAPQGTGGKGGPPMGGGNPAGSAKGGGASGTPDGTSPTASDEAARRAVSRGLDWLAKQQNADAALTNLGLAELALSGQKDEVQNYILLGDLHLKQGRAADAAEAYRQAIETLQKEGKKQEAELLRRIYLDLTGTVPGAEVLKAYLEDNDPHKRAKVTERLLKEAKDAPYKERVTWLLQNKASNKASNSQSVQRDLTALELYTKLAQAYLSAGDKDRALKTLELLAKQAQDAGQLVQAPRSRPADAAKPAAGATKMPLPSRLILSAPKRLLDLVGSGKISYEEFKQQVSLDYYSFGEPAAQPAKEKK